MRGPKPDRLNLTEVERNELERLVRRHGTAQQVALRGRIIWEAHAGKNKSQVARELGLSGKSAIIEVREVCLLTMWQ